MNTGSENLYSVTSDEQFLLFCFTLSEGRGINLEINKEINQNLNMFSFWRNVGLRFLKNMVFLTVITLRTFSQINVSDLLQLAYAVIKISTGIKMPFRVIIQENIYWFTKQNHSYFLFICQLMAG